ncbi:MAG TPA: 5-oxoprolinase subunit PxpA [Ramlibacter sp.]|uniref:LamB/YcsF family protein n=1 Tax=Ramlibacter sp. TaxID=1917967 RepID=UPI002ED1619B
MDIDLNADLGEGFGPWRMGQDEDLLEIVSSANIACGFHAGDPLIMQRTVQLARARGIDVGAHVGFPDRQGFGRRVMQVEVNELAAMVVYQLGALAGIARAAGCRMTHMSFHGALGNMAAADAALAQPLLEAVAAFDPKLVISSSSSQAIEAAAARLGLTVASTFLADRAYDDEGLLVPRKLPDSVIKHPAKVLTRVRQFLREGTVTTYGGGTLRMQARSILLHGDTPGAVELARTIRAEIEASGGAIVPISRQLL